MHANSELLFKKHALPYFSRDSRVLEIGPTGNPSHYCRLVNDSTIRWHTLDIDTDYLSGGEKHPLHIVSTSEYCYPVEDDMFDLVVSGQVMEHVGRIWTWLKELERITKPGGKIVIISPTSWPYHEAPIDCWRIYPDGMRLLVADFTHLEVVVCAHECLESQFLDTPEIIEGRSSIDLQMKPLLKVRRKMLFNRVCARLAGIHRHFGNYIIPIEAAYDNICVLRKPAT